VRELIYALCSDGTPHYVGKSLRGVERAHAHLMPSARGRVAEWARGRNVEIRVLEYVTADTASERERWWIAQGRKLGWPLLNIKNGGEGVRHRGATRRALVTSERLLLMDGTAIERRAARVVVKFNGLRATARAFGVPKSTMSDFVRGVR